MSNRTDTTSSKIDDLTPEQRRALLQQLLREKAKPHTQQSAIDRCCHELFDERARSRPDAPAIIYGDQSLSYSELNLRANQLAHYIESSGLGYGSLIAVALPPSIDLVIAMLGILKSGAACLPLNPRLPQKWNDGLLATAQPQLCLTGRNFATSLTGTQILSLNAIEHAVLRQDRTDRADGMDAESLAFVIGPTRRLVEIDFRGLGIQLRSLQERFALDESDRVLLTAPPDHENLLWQVLWPLIYGSSIVIPGAGDSESAAVQRAISEKSVTVAQFHPAALEDLLALVTEGRRRDLDSLRSVMCGNGALRRQVAAKVVRNIGENAQYFYGLPETIGPMTIQAIGPIEDDVMTVGASSSAIYLLDDREQLVPIGIAGHIYSGADSLARGYRFDDGETSRRFIANAFSKVTGARLFKTLEQGRRLNDGRVALNSSGRRHGWIDGYRVDAAGIEAAILGDPSVRDCAVVFRDRDGGLTEIMAYVVSTAPSGPLYWDALRKSLADQLPPHFLPSAFLAITVVPLTASGELDEAALVALEAIDEEIANRWEKAIQAAPGVDRAAVVLRPNVERRPPLHESDLLPREIREAARFSGQSEAAHSETRSQAIEDDVWAYSDGGPLIIPDDAPRTLTAALLRTASRSAQSGMTFVYEDGSEEFQTYASMLDEAQRVLTGLRDHGLKRGSSAILQIRSLREHYAVFWGCVLGGITPVTVAVASSYEASNAVVRKLHGTWELLGNPPVLASDDLEKQLAGLKGPLSMESLNILKISALLNNEPATQIYESQPEDVLFLQLTSGSTGIPKCIQITHRGVVAHVHGAQQFNFYRADNVSLNWLPMDHVVPILTSHLKDVYLGCHQVVMPSSVVLADATRWLDLIERHRVTHTWSPNFGFKLVVNSLTKAVDRTWNLSSIERFMNAGEQVTLPVVREFLRLVAPFGVSETAMQPAFGMAEACTCMTYQNEFDCDRGVYRADKSSLGSTLTEVSQGESESIDFIGLGGPVPGVEIRIADRENRVVRERVIGRLQIRGAVVTPGYLNNDEANREAFVGDAWFNSGDLGFIRNGELTLTGREKEIIIVNGANFYCYEIEDIVNEVEGVEPTFAAATGLSDPLTGTEGLAVFFSGSGKARDEDIDTIRRIRSRVTASLGISPIHVVPVDRSDFPKTTSGKIQRTKLRNQLSEGVFDDVLKKIDIQLENARTIPDWFLETRWRRDNRLTYGEMLEPRVQLVLVDELGVGEAIAQRIERLRTRCVRVSVGSEFERIDKDAYRINPVSASDYDQLIRFVQDEGDAIGGILHLWTYCDLSRGVEAVEEELDLGPFSLLLLMQALNRLQGPTSPVNLRIVSRCSQAVLTGEQVSPARTSLIGLFRTMTQEMPWVTASHVDLPCHDLQADIECLQRELASTSKDACVAYRGGDRFIQRLERATLSNVDRETALLKSGGCFLITGGLGGVGVQLARYLLEVHGCRVLLVGRMAGGGLASDAVTAGLQDERMEALRALERVGGNVMYSACDIADEEDLQRTVDKALGMWGANLDGVFHLAGVFREKMLTEETVDGLKEVMRPKVQGTLAVARLLENHPNAFLATFSSVNAFFGGVAVGGYSAANSFLFGFAQSQLVRRNHCFLWSMWDDTGMSRGYAHKDLSRARGYYAIPDQLGIKCIRIGLEHSGGPLLIGVDASSAQIRPFVEAKVQQSQRLAGYFSSGTSGLTGETHRDLHEVRIDDRFGKRTSCDVIDVKEFPLLETGEIDRASLAQMDSLRTRRQRAMPRTELESRIAVIWQTVLNLPQVGVHDSFFELGGHSLLAVRLVFRLREVFNVEFPVDKVIENPTIASMSRWIESHLLEKEDSGVSEPAIRSNCLLPLQSRGDGLPFFCVHPAGGSPLCYVNLAGSLGEERPFYGFQAPGLFGECEPLTRVEEMAEQYVAAMKTVQPSGPYLVGGWSSGGPVAFEIARLLESRNEEVGIVAFFDCGLMESDAGMGNRRKVSPADLVKGLLMIAKFSWQIGIPLSYQDLRLLGQFGGISLPPTLRDVFGRGPASTFRVLRSLKSEIRRSVEIFRLNSLAGLKYEPRRYNGRVVLFRAAASSNGAADPVIADLKKYSAGVEVHPVPGNHMSIILDKNGSSLLAEKLKRCLDRY